MNKAKQQWHAYTVALISDLHAGSGDENYGVIDNLVQRDAADRLPCVFGSSMKGAIKEFMEHYQPNLVAHVFGQGDKVNMQAGTYTFTAAHLLAIPMRSNIAPYLLATSPYCAKQFKRWVSAEQATKLNWLVELEKLKAKDGEPLLYGGRSSGGSVYLEDFEFKTELKDAAPAGLQSQFGSLLAIAHEKDFIKMVDDLHLPVRARNHLDDGQQSVNLWYEQFVPRMSVFYTFIAAPEGDPHWADFHTSLTEHFMQIGGNKSVGNGICRFESISFTSENVSDEKA